MALVSCKECGKEVSTTAPACPHCGAPFPGTTTGRLVIYRREGIVAGIRRLFIYLDDNEVGTIYPRETFSLDLSEGKYSLRATLAGAKSNQHEIFIQAGRTISIEAWYEYNLLGFARVEFSFH